MVAGMVRRGLMIAPLLAGLLWLWGGTLYAWSGIVGLGMALLNLWVSARLIGGVADRNPQLLMAVGLATYALGLVLVTVIALILNALDLVFFPVTGITLVGSHLLRVLWEASAGGIPAPESKAQAPTRPPAVRS